MSVALVLFGAKGRIHFSLPSHIYFAFSNKRFLKNFFSSLSLPRSFIILFYAREVINHQSKKKKKKIVERPQS